jgi:DNA-binding beta-propeller fold protein YncE
MKAAVRIGGLCLCALLFTLAWPGGARASRELLSEEAVNATETPDGQIEGACGVAIGEAGQIYVSDYYHGVVDVFGGGGGYQSRIPTGASPEGPCQLAPGPGGALYVNHYHQGVFELGPSEAGFDPAASTGVALDAAGDVYVNHRSRVSVYQPSGAPLLFEGQPLQIGLGSLHDAYGLAVSSFAATEGDVYVADAADDTVKVFEPAEPENPSEVIDGSTAPGGGFSSLTDAALAIDPTNGHLLVADNLQPGFEHPEAAIDEFSAAGAFLGRLPNRVIDALPVGLALDPAGELYATSGDTEEANVFHFGSYGASFGPSQAPVAPGGGGASAATAAPARPGALSAGNAPRPPAASASEITQRGHLRVAFEGSLSPHALPRQGTAPVRVTVGAKITTTDGKVPPQLRKISIAINRNGHFDPTGLPVCRLDQIQPSTTEDALAACRSSLIGEGRFSAKVLLAGQAPFPSDGKVYAFNSRLHGKPAILAHVYGPRPAPASYTLPFVIGKAKGTFANVLTASLPAVTADSGYITGLEMTLGRSFSYRGKRHSYLSAGCPAPKGFPGAAFPFARASFGFGAETVTSTLTRSCGVRG